MISRSSILCENETPRTGLEFGSFNLNSTKPRLHPVSSFYSRQIRHCSCGCFLVGKKDGTHRLVYDFRKINQLLEDEIYYTPTLPEVVQKIGEVNGKIFTNLDLRNAYNQLLVAPCSKQFVSFSCFRGQFCFNRAPFGIKTLPCVFQRLMNCLLSRNKFLQQHAVVFIDDLLLFSETIEEHRELLKILFELLREVNLKLHPKKCSLIKKEVTYIGHKFSNGMLQPDETKVQRMLAFKKPDSKATLKAYVSLLSYYRQFMKNFASVSSPLMELLKKDVKFHWGEKQEESYQKLQKMLMNLPILKIPDERSNNGYIIHTDSSNKAVAFTISQLGDDNKEHLLVCFSRLLKPHEQRFAIHQKEILALVLACLKYRHWLLSNKPITIVSDNLSVRYLQTIKSSLSPRLIRWSIMLDPILSRAKFRHISSSQNVVADSLSRLISTNNEAPSAEEVDFFDDGFVASVEQCVNNCCTENICADNVLSENQLNSLCNVVTNCTGEDYFYQQSADQFNYDGGMLSDHSLNGSDPSISESRVGETDTETDQDCNEFIKFEPSCNSLQAGEAVAMSITYNCETPIAPKIALDNNFNKNTLKSILYDIAKVIADANERATSGNSSNKQSII